jgi:hypothetical protein
MKQLQLERETRGLNRYELGILARIHPARLGSFENGRARPPQNGVELARIAAVLRWRRPPITLLDDVDDHALAT